MSMRVLQQLHAMNNQMLRALICCPNAGNASKLWTCDKARGRMDDIVMREGRHDPAAQAEGGDWSQLRTKGMVRTGTRRLANDRTSLSYGKIALHECSNERLFAMIGCGGVDSWDPGCRSAMFGGADKEHLTCPIRALLRPLSALAMNSLACVSIVVHLSKQTRRIFHYALVEHYSRKDLMKQGRIDKN